MLRQTTLTSDERPLYFFDFPPEVLFFPYGTMPRVTSPIFQTHDEAHTHTYARAHTLPHHRHQHHHQHKHDEFYSRTIAYTKTRKRGRATILETLVFNIRRSFEVLVSSRYFAQTRPRCTYVYIYFEFTFDSMNYCDIPTNCRPLIYSPPPLPVN